MFFFDAIEPQQVEDYAAQLAISVTNCHLSQGELGCLFSHVLLWKKVIDENIDYVAIFEDDIYLGEHAKVFLDDDEWIKAEWDIIKIEKNSKFNYLSLTDKTSLANGRVISRLLNPNFGTAGYIISNKAAKSLLSYIQSLSIVDHIDQIIFKKYLKHGVYPIYQVNPALCIQEYLLYPMIRNSSLAYLGETLIKRKKEILYSRLKESLKGYCYSYIDCLLK